MAQEELQEQVTKTELVDLIQLLKAQLLMVAEAAEAVVQALVLLEVLVEAVLELEEVLETKVIVMD